MSWITGRGARRRTTTVAKRSPVNAKARLTAAMMGLLAFGGITAAPADPVRHTLPGYARSMVWDAESGVLVASLTLKGVAFLKVEDGQIRASFHREEWPTMDGISVGGGRYLLAGRFGHLRLVEPAGHPHRELSFRDAATWDFDGIPTNLTWDGTTLYIAAGGAGVFSYQWDGTTTEPRLTGRYPFVDYSKEMSLSPANSTLFLADNRDTGLQVLDVSDPRRMRQLLQRGGDFIDSLSRHESLLAVTFRHSGVAIYDISMPEFPNILAEIPVSTRAHRSDPAVSQVRFDGEGRLMICEGHRGARFFGMTETSSGVVPNLLWELPRDGGTAGSVVFLGNSHAAICSLDGTLTILRTQDMAQP